MKWEKKDILIFLFYFMLIITVIIVMNISIIYDFANWILILFMFVIVSISSILLFFFNRERRKRKIIKSQIESSSEDISDEYVVQSSNIEEYLKESKKIMLMVSEILKPIKVDKNKIPLNSFCIISKTPLENSESILQCPICSNYFIERYLLAWLESNDFCPVCRTKLIEKKKEKLTANEILKLIS